MSDNMDKKNERRDEEKKKEKEALARKVTERLQKLLKERGISQYRLAELSGLSTKTIDPIFAEYRLPELPTLEKISFGFDITLSELLNFDGDPKNVMTSDEKDIIECYRQMPEREKRRILGYFQGLVKKDL